MLTGNFVCKQEAAKIMEGTNKLGLTFVIQMGDVAPTFEVQMGDVAPTFVVQMGDVAPTFVVQIL